MESTALRKTSSFKDENLTRNDYTVSLLNEGLRAGILSSDQIATFQHQLMLLMRKSIERYTRGQSSSVRTAVAQNILISNMFTIDVYLLSLSVEDALAALCAHSVQSLWDMGQKWIALSIESCKELFKKVQQTRLDIGLIAYDSTIDEAFDEFFKNYEFLFAAHDTMGMIDYPLALDEPNLRGILYMKQYLQKLLLENEFCGLFKSAELTALLKNYGRQYRTDYKELLINIFELTFSNSILSVLLLKHATKLSLSSYEVTLLEERLCRVSAVQLPLLLDEAIERVCADLALEDVNSIAYLHRYKAVFTSRLVNAIEQGTLQSFAITDGCEKHQEVLAFKEGKKLDDKSFRVVLNRIQKGAGAQEKAEIIHNQLHSFTDFVDILRSNCLEGEEFEILYRHLDDLELSLLTKKILIDEFGNPTDERPLSDLLEEIENTGIDYVDALVKFLKDIEDKRLTALQKTIESSIISS